MCEFVSVRGGWFYHSTLTYAKLNSCRKLTDKRVFYLPSLTDDFYHNINNHYLHMSNTRSPPPKPTLQLEQEITSPSFHLQAVPPFILTKKHSELPPTHIQRHFGISTIV